MSQCSLKNCDNECFKNENECVLHCKKDKDNDWFDINEEKKNWNTTNIDLFWNCIQKVLDKKYTRYLLDKKNANRWLKLSNVIFPKFQAEVEDFYSGNHDRFYLKSNFYSYNKFQHINEEKVKNEVNKFFDKCKIIFIDCIFLDWADFEKYNLEEEIIFENCEFKSGLFLSDIYKKRVSFFQCIFEDLNCSYINFKDNIKIQECIFNQEANFYNAKFEKLADFYKTEFNEVSFEKTDFKDISVFTEVTFNLEVDFKFTTFEKLTLFRKTIFVKSVNLIDSIIKEEANFLGIESSNGKLEKENIENRETARIIKNSFEKENNIIEANKFYALEMKKREEELNNEIKDDSWARLDKTIFMLHNITSGHSQNWFLALRWILIVGLLYALFKQTSFDINVTSLFLGTLLLSPVIIDLILIPIKIKKREKYFNYLNIFLYSLILLTLSVKNFDVKYFLNVINPLSKIKVDIPLDMFIVKVIIAYLIYQFIIAVRQNTRRK